MSTPHRAISVLAENLVHHTTTTPLAFLLDALAHCWALTGYCNMSNDTIGNVDSIPGEIMRAIASHVVDVQRVPRIHELDVIGLLERVFDGHCGSWLASEYRSAIDLAMEAVTELSVARDPVTAWRQDWATLRDDDWALLDSEQQAEAVTLLVKRAAKLLPEGS